MEKLNTNDLLKYSLALSSLIIGMSVAYYFVVYIPQKDKIERDVAEKNLQLQIKKERDEKEEALTQKKGNLILYTGCLGAVERDYMINWNRNCPVSGIDTKEENCSLPDHIVKNLEDFRKNETDSCSNDFPH
ncbi:MAG: hypothetical protein Q7S57_02085 [bacterium]|nr:hypothetical protein [bacterium]